MTCHSFWAKFQSPYGHMCSHQMQHRDHSSPPVKQKIMQWVFGNRNGILHLTTVAAVHKEEVRMDQWFEDKRGNACHLTHSLEKVPHQGNFTCYPKKKESMIHQNLVVKGKNSNISGSLPLPLNIIISQFTFPILI